MNQTADELKRVKKQLQTITSESDQLRESMENFESSKSTSDSLKEEFSKLKQEKSDLVLSIKSKDEETSRNQQEISRLKDQIEILVEKSKKVDESFTMSSNELQTSEARRNSVLSEMEGLKSEHAKNLSGVKTKLEKDKSELHILQNRSEEIIKHQKSQIEVLLAGNEKNIKKYAESQQNLSELKMRMDEMQNEVEKRTVEARLLQSQAKEGALANKSKREMHERIQELVARTAETEKLRMQFEGAMMKAREDNSNLKLEVEALRDELTRSGLKIDELASIPTRDEEVSELEDKLGATELESKSVQNNLLELQQKFERLSARYDARESYRCESKKLNWNHLFMKNPKITTIFFLHYAKISSTLLLRLPSRTTGHFCYRSPRTISKRKQHKTQ